MKNIKKLILAFLFALLVVCFVVAIGVLAAKLDYGWPVLLVLVAIGSLTAVFYEKL